MDLDFNNSFCTIVAFYNEYMEVGIGKQTTEEFTYVYYIKSLSKNEGFWYTSNRGLDVEGVWGTRDNMGKYKDKFFYFPSERSGEFRFASECLLI